MPGSQRMPSNEAAAPTKVTEANKSFIRRPLRKIVGIHGDLLHGTV